jgi:hypothetical protein
VDSQPKPEEKRPNFFGRKKDTLQGIQAAIGIPIALVGGTYGVCSWYFGESVTREVTLRNLPLIAGSAAGLIVVLLLALVKVLRRLVVVGVVGGALAWAVVWLVNQTPAPSPKSPVDPTSTATPAASGTATDGRPAAPPPESVTNSVGMTFARVDAGATPFLLMTTKLTQRQLRQVRPAARPSYFSAGGRGAQEVEGVDTADWPAESQTYPDARAAAAALSELPAEREAGRVYRLPTDAEFAAAAAGEPAAPAHLSNPSALHRLKRPAPVSPAAGRFGLVGNVREWVACDRAAAGTAVALGGSFAETPAECHPRCPDNLKAVARPLKSEYGLAEVGFRFVCELRRP